MATFEAGLLGFPDAHDFDFESLGETLEPFARMVSRDWQGLSFVVVPPGVVFPDYSVELEEDVVANLQLADAGEAVVLVLVAPGATGPTANLLGPIVINRRTHLAAQVVQHRSSYGTAVLMAPAA